VILSRLPWILPLAVANVLVACQSTPDVVPVGIRNVTSVSVTLKQCDVRCNEIHRVETLSPGRTATVVIGTDGVANYWMVERDGKNQGCLKLIEDGYHTGDVVSVTETVTCPA
jgi:hypothetical protein